MIRLFSLLLIFLLPLLPGQAEENLLATLKPQHPRLLVTDSTWKDLAAKRQHSPTLDRLLKKLEADGRALLPEPPLTRKMTGRRLLEVSRDALKRIMLWSFDYRITGDKVFLERAEKEMIAVAGFSDWNPTHFLDVGEMTAAMAIGYDWLDQDLSPAARQTVRQAILDKGLAPGLDFNAPFNGWQNGTNNWNAVCFGGLTLGALAVAEDAPEVANRMLTRVRAQNPRGMKGYAPAGCYPEGPSYWTYGTTYEVLLLAALESALGTDWGLSKTPGFLATATYPVDVTGPSGMTFDYSDSRPTGGVTPVLYWLARRTGQPDVLHFQHAYLEKILDTRKGGGVLPLLAIWAGDLDDHTPPQRPLNVYLEGENPLAIFRSSWTDPNALYVAIKGGSASISHGHMDAGSFILEADGVRWAIDLGMQEYESLESKGIKLWQGTQDGARWDIFRLGNLSHNTLVINGQRHRVDGHASVTMPKTDGPATAVIDLSSTFKGQAEKVTRKFTLLPDRLTRIEDEISGLKPGDQVRWAFATGAKVTAEGRHAVLRQDGKTLRIDLAAPLDGHFEVISGDLQNGIDAPNPGVSLLIATLIAPASGQLRIKTAIQPGEGPRP